MKKKNAIVTDILSFGPDIRDVSQSNARLEQCFIEEVKVKFPVIRIRDAYDHMRGFRQSIEIAGVDLKHYHAWLVARGWDRMSSSMAAASTKDAAFVDRVMAAAKEQYPHVFEAEG